MAKNDRTVEFEGVTCIRATDAALLCVIDGDEVWLPKSHIHDDSEVFDDRSNAKGKLVITEWIATQKRLV